MFMKIRIVVPLIACIVMTIGSVSTVFAMPVAWESIQEPVMKQKLQKLDETADELYEAAYTNNRQAGYKYAQLLERQTKSETIRAVGQTEGWQLFEQRLQMVETALQNGTQPSDWLTASASIHLATDALLRPQHALWLQYEKVMMEDLRRINQSWNRQTGDGALAARAALDSFTAHLAKIEGAAAMQRPSARLDELKERMRYTQLLLDAGTRGQAKQDWTDDSIRDLEYAVSNLFDDGLNVNDEPAFAPVNAANPITWSLLLGAIIMAALTYTGWKKYKHMPYGVKKI
ncbi:sporulation protein YpjB [Paenibacillus sp. NEAU-GSW1]|uniref:sporulation protein YpjB n=1 Tax=Paenibacillus sp. NEAU-GSW1 TaxID=2682486 RepID=UPI001567993E|nr:sporulation protein YpjB [Paenibacillus sp. NEAU-GSW1]